MTISVDYLIIGSGLTGSVLARTLHDAGYRVLIVERRPHVGGNVHDHLDSHGIRIHTYGPHYFRTSSDKLWSFVNRYASFYRYEACLKTFVDGTFEQWPIAQEYIHRAIGSGWKPDFTGIPGNFEEASLSMMPRQVYEKFVKGYTEKQWGVPATTLDKELAGRFDVRLDNEPRLKTQKYQGIPSRGYAVFMQNIIEGIPIWMNFDYLHNKDAIDVSQLTIFTGPIDEYFGFDIGKLRYRGQQRIHRFVPDVDFALPCGQVNFPAPEHGNHVRTLEWKHMMQAEHASLISGTVLTDEIPYTPAAPDAFEYPFPDSENKKLYQAYRAKADLVPKLLICGRLGEYRYFDMDQAIGRAFVLAERILALGQMAALSSTIEKVHLTSKILDGIGASQPVSVERPHPSSHNDGTNREVPRTK